MQLFLTHVDTPYRMYHEKRTLSDSNLHVSLPFIASYTHTSLVFAYWSDYRLDDNDAWNAYLTMRDDTRKKCQSLPHNPTLLYAMEDARPLVFFPEERLDQLWQDGVRILTPLWRGVSVIGGAYDTDIPLTSCGEAVVEQAIAMGMIPDISHAGKKSAQDIFRLASRYKAPVIASHSNFYAICPHPRNLTDKQALRIAESGGLIGLSFVPSHMGADDSIDALLSHIDHARTLGLERHLCLGTDFDGTDRLPNGIANVAALQTLASYMLQRGYESTFIEDLFWRNATRILTEAIPK